MKTMMFRLLKTHIINFILSEIMSDAFKRRLVAKVNKAVNIPGLSEKEEEVIFLKLLNATQESITEQLS